MNADVYKTAREAKIYTFDVHNDQRGSLSVQDFSSFPVSFTRLFVLNSVDPSLKRGGHAHKKCWQFLFTPDSGIKVTILNKKSTEAVELRDNMGLLVPPYNWLEIEFSKSDSYLNVLASESYDPSDYIYARPIRN